MPPISSIYLLILISMLITAIPIESLHASQKDSALYKNSYALVIGIDNYINGWPKLSNATKDARLIAKELSKQGFQTQLEIDTSTKELRKILQQFFIVKGANKDTRLLMWFAGHGHSVNGEGFLIPADAPNKLDPNLKLSAIHMREFGSLLRLAESKHILTIFDSCFSGTIFSKRRGRISQQLAESLKHPVRQFITSGDANQLVLDNGAFRELFIRSIRGDEAADLNKDGYLTANELGTYLSDTMIDLTNSLQTPQYGKIIDGFYDNGEFIIARHKPHIMSKNTSSTALTKLKSESRIWQSALKLNSEEGYNVYLKHYPKGLYANFARKELKTRFADHNSTVKTYSLQTKSRSAPNPLKPGLPPSKTQLKKPPSMTELMALAKKRRNENQHSRTIPSNRSKCINSCNSRYYNSITDAQYEQDVETSCSMSTEIQSNYDACYKKSLSSWSQREKRTCIDRC